MSLRAIRWAFKVGVKSATERLVLLCVADMANASHFCWPSQNTIAAITCLSARSVRAALKSLEQQDLIRRERVQKGPLRSSDRIFVLLSPAETTAGSERNGLPLPPGSACHESYNREPTRFNHLDDYVLEICPLPERPDIWIHNTRVSEFTKLERWTNDVIDWNAPGITNVSLILEWFDQHSEDTVSKCIAMVVDRRRRMPGVKKRISSWSYFSQEMKLL